VLRPLGQRGQDQERGLLHRTLTHNIFIFCSTD
jgi:hypothetical protein